MTAQAADFFELGLEPPLLAALEQMGLNRPTPIQAAAIPPLLEGRDLLASAPTGAGKTAAFVLPALQKLIDDPTPPRQPRQLFLAPTRELAVQIADTFRALGRNLPFRIDTAIGGIALQRWQQTETPHALVGTPGRLLTLVGEGTLDLSAIELLVIDEADRLLDMGLGPDVMALLETMPQPFQAALFSATLAGAGVETFSEAILDDPVRIDLTTPDTPADQVQQAVLHAGNETHRRQLLRALVTDPACQRALVFTNRKETAEKVNDWLRQHGITSTVLHGDLPAPARLARIEAYRQGRYRVLVATDLAGRGLDVPDITHVINYDTPTRADIYIHRIGRTGRGQRTGVAYTLVTFDALPHLHRIEYRLGRTLPVETLPDWPLPGSPFEERLKALARKRKQQKKARRLAEEKARRKALLKRRRKKRQRHRAQRDKGRPRWLKAKAVFTDRTDESPC